MENESTLAKFPERAPVHQRLGERIHTTLRAFGLLLLAFVLVGASAFASMYNTLQNSIEQHNIDELIAASDRPTENQAPLDQKSGEALNILLLGADRMVNGSMRSDTTIIAHISADRSRVDMVSIPRDTLVDIPPCTLGDGSMSAESPQAMFNSAFNTGLLQGGNIANAAACTMKTVERLTGIYLDGFMVVDFDSFQAVVDSIGGIDVCLADAIHDKSAHLDLEAGCQHLDGEQALALSRVRKSVGDGSDIGRISRQHQVINAIVDRILQMNLFTDLPKMYNMIQEVTSHMDMSEGLGDIQWLGGLAYSMRGVDTADLNSYTMPFAPAGARVLPASSAQQVWDALINDAEVPESALNTDNAPAVILDASPQDLADFAQNAGVGITVK